MPPEVQVPLQRCISPFLLSAGRCQGLDLLVVALGECAASALGSNAVDWGTASQEKKTHRHTHSFLSGLHRSVSQWVARFVHIF